MDFFETLANLPLEQQALLAGVVGWALTQAVKWVWMPPVQWKLQKLLTAVALTGLTTWAAQFADWQGGSHFAIAWACALLAAVGFHEVTAKSGLQHLIRWDRGKKK